ncbi:MAG: hypothetical protein OXF49_00910 [Candidatus Saccharibacteria bacterium]|nr:hypothetical protein [Candidatus Saccharibacteria bacterium]
MLYLANQFLQCQVISLETLKIIGHINGILVDPYRFEVAGFWIQPYTKNYKHWPVLLRQSMRQFDDQKVYVNSIHELNSPLDLPKLKQILEEDYQIPDKKIISTDQKTLGIAENFSFHSESFKIMHVIMKPPIHRRLSKSRQQFERRQIEKITPKIIEVNINPKKQRLQSIPTKLIS